MQRPSSTEIRINRLIIINSDTQEPLVLLKWCMSFISCWSLLCSESSDKHSLVCCVKIQSIFLWFVILYSIDAGFWDMLNRLNDVASFFYIEEQIWLLCALAFHVSLMWSGYVSCSQFSLFPRKVARRGTAVCSDARLSVGFILIIQSIRHLQY